jgi:hypothetical protein
MDSNIDLIIEVYETLKQHIPTKDRQEASDALMSILVEYLPDDELAVFGAVDSYTKRSIQDYATDDEIDDYGDSED